MSFLRGVFYLQSFYSLLQSLNSLEKLVLQAKENDYDFIALSDENNLYGMLTFLKLCQKHQIKPILGIKINFTWNNQVGELLVYAKNETGIKNLIQLSTMVKNIDKNNIPLAKIIPLGKGLFTIITGLCPFFEKLFKTQEKKVFKELLNLLQDIFDDVFLGVSFQSLFLEMLSDHILDFAAHFHLPCLPVHKTNYITPEFKKTWQILSQMENRKIESDLDLSFLTKNGFDNKYQNYNTILHSCKKLINQINYQNYQLKNITLPFYLDYQNDKSQDNKKEDQPKEEKAKTISLQNYLKQLSYEGLKNYINPQNPQYLKYQQRLEQELTIIHEMNYHNYFLIVNDVIKYAKKQGILVGPGRGSSSGSLVCFCLQITEIDPLKYNLIFERFLNPQRKTMPDIDLDFPDNKRDIVIKYMCQKYGLTHVANIITFGRFMNKKAIIKELIKFKKVMPFQIKGIFSFLNYQALQKNKVLTPIPVSMDFKMKELLQMASHLEEVPRFTGTHPAGLILSQSDLTKTIPLQKSNYNNLQQTQWEATDLETIGLFKIDFLGLRSLTLIKKIVIAINTINPNFSLFDIPLKDEKTFKLLQQGETLGIFQLESPKAKLFLQKMKPQNFEELIALLALNRPGTIDSFNLFLTNRNRKTQQQHFFHPLINEILKPTYGIILYQEQIIQIAASFAKYTLAEADLFRKAISKKEKNLLLQEKERFLNKSHQQGHNLLLANKIYDYILKFANYGFNKSHSVAYSLISYRMAYLKANFNIIFMIVLLNDALNNSLQTYILLQEIAKSNVSLEKPNVFTSSSKYYFNFNQNKLFLPLNMIKGVNLNFCHELIKKRSQKSFESFSDFKERLAFCLNETILTNLIFSGALDHIGFNRKTLFHNKNLEEVKYYRYLEHYEPVLHQEYSPQELISNEIKVFGFNLTNLKLTKNKIIKTSKHLLSK
ncbi:DNA polymerase III subunit alpha ['Fragaria x ananassa' phyllody phytoplasma]|uniref:DNA-directed DNA polymerase n=1 Tax='Fragaria x ananassa' phyllody phytoplasma TaxID=2358428 RepID=A0ABS5K3D6_9MOLU|nr:DNA polymerase III subunit alpha ['Fragaria x ananassa' phyllody phytoplasma]MBS2126426.1 DNA polymerase III subunit alpha ['Fragaria x ananassa' phyllody phytoplasma]